MGVLLGKSVLILWPLIALALFWSTRIPIATSIVIFGGMMILPERIFFDPPLIPRLGEMEITSLSILLGVSFRNARLISSSRLGRGVDLLFLVLVLAAYGTVIMNRDPLLYGPTALPGLSMYDGLSMGMHDLLTIGLPFLLGKAVFRTPRDVRDLLTVFVVAMLLYSIPMLAEIRLSPQLHKWVYGFHQGQFLQMVRPSGGYRPVVFMESALALALLTAISVIAATTLYRAGQTSFFPFPRAAIAYLTGLLILCKSLASLTYGLVFLPITALLRPRNQMRIAVGLALLVLLFPWMRMRGVFPTEKILAAAESIDPARARSLKFRFDQEDVLIEKTRARMTFGWGGYNRAKSFNEVTGRLETVVDGYWIVMCSQRGFIGFAASFGLLLFPIFNAFRRLPRIRGRKTRSLIAGLSMILAIYSIDLLPNGLFVLFPFYLAGALESVTWSLANTPRRRERPGRETNRKAI